MNYKSFAIQDNKLEAYNQGLELANSFAYHNEKIRLMCDSHQGVSGPIGFTSTFSDKLIVQTVGVDISCRVSAFNLPYEGTFDEQELERLDKVINKVVPTGFSVRDKECKFSQSFPYEELHCWDSLKNHDRLRKSMGSLGGGKLDCLRAA